MKTKLLGILAAAMLAGPMTAAAAPVEVTYSVSGSAGNWTLDFSVTNSLQSANSEMAIYFFGVRLSARNILASPPGWNPDTWPNWDNSSYGGTSGFNNNWLEGTFVDPPAIGFGRTLSGFDARVTTADAPASVDWFAFAFSPGAADTYTGPTEDITFVYRNRNNPGFEGVATATVASVPEPATVALLGLALAALGVSRRRKLH